MAHDAGETPAVVVACAHNVGYFQYYLSRQGSPRRVQRLVQGAGDVDAVLALAAAARATDVWLLAGHRVPEPALIAGLRARMPLVEERHFTDAAAWHFRPAPRAQ